MMNPEIAKLVLNEKEGEAKKILKRYKASYRVTHRDGSPLKYVTDDRDDNRYSMIVENGIVVRVYGG